MKPLPPDVVLLAAEWQPRALLRAQLIEEGLDVRAAETWEATRPMLRPGLKPRLVIVDLKGLPDPWQVLRDLAVLMPAERVVVLSALGSVEPDRIARLRFRVVARPVAIAEIVRAAAAIDRGRD